MKNIVKSILALTLSAFIFTSCEDEQDLNFITPPASFSIITPQEGESIVLNETTPNNPGLSLSWGSADYLTPTQVDYSVEVAAVGTEFAAVQVLVTTSNEFATVQSAQLNLAALIAGAEPFVATPIDIRIKATVGSTDPVYSNTITYVVTTYGCLGQFAVGAGIPSAGWNWDSPLSLICDDNVLTATATLANDTFRFFTTAGDWNSGRNFPYYITEGYKITSNLVNAADGDQNFRFQGTPGVHRIKIDANTKMITAYQGNTAANSQWLVGAATPGGWSWAGSNETELGIISNGVYEVTLNLTSNEAFRVFLGNNGGDSWGLGDRNYPWYVSNGYTIDSELINAADGDSNFRYTGATGVRVFKINSITKVISVN